MTIALQPLISEFTITGRLEDFIVNSKGRVKSLYVSTAEEDYSIEVAKERKNILGKYLQPGCYLKVTGMRKYRLDRDRACYKAYRIELLTQQSPAETESAKIKSAETKSVTNKPKAKILVCQGSSCCKKGSQRICNLLHTELKTKGITEEVEIKTTGCMKQCKQAPYLIMPVKNSYRGVQPQQVSKIVSKHFR